MTLVLRIPLAVLVVWLCRTIPGNRRLLIMTARDQTQMTDRERAEEKRTLHDALGFRIETTDIAIAKLGG